MTTIPKPWRLEERDATGTVLAATEQGWDGPLGGGEAHHRFAREVRTHPGRYAPDSPHRLVLLAPTRTESDR